MVLWRGVICSVCGTEWCRNRNTRCPKCWESHGERCADATMEIHRKREAEALDDKGGASG
jgi:hypothetical protein